MSGASGKLGGGYSGNAGGVANIPGFNSKLFDHALGKPLRALVQDAIVNLLARLDVANGGYLLAIEPTTTQIHGIAGGDEQGLALLYDQLRGRAPAILVTTCDKSYSPAGDSFRWLGKLNVEIYFFVNSLRSRIARLAGDVVSDFDPLADPGIYVIMEHVEELLIGQNPGGTLGQIKELRPVAENQIAGDDEVEIWRQVYSVVLARSINDKRDIDLELREIATYHRLADHQADTDEPIVTTETDLT